MVAVGEPNGSGIPKVYGRNKPQGSGGLTPAGPRVLTPPQIPVLNKNPGPFKPGTPKMPTKFPNKGRLRSEEVHKRNALRRDKIMKGLRKGGPSKGQLAKIRLGAMRAKAGKK